MFTSSSNQPAKLQAILLKSELAIAWRNNKWVLLGRRAAQQRELPKPLFSTIEQWIAQGQLVAGEDGNFRLNGAKIVPLQRADESPFSKLNNRRDKAGGFDQEQIRAADKLRDHYDKAHLSPRVTANYAPRILGNESHINASDNAVAQLSDNAIAARRKVHDALEVVGPELASILLKIVCLDVGFEEAERQLDLPRRAGKAVLSLALSRLARNYGFKQKQRHLGPDKIGHWATSDFRPQIQPQVPAAHQP